MQKRTAAQQSQTFAIPSPKPSSRCPANIPLRTLSHSNSQSASLLGVHSDEKQGRRSSLSRSTSPSSEFSWSDTGDLAEQLADAEDPLHDKLRSSLEEGIFAGSSRRHSRPKKVRYQSKSPNAERKSYHPGLVKEEIQIPNPGPRYITRAENIIAIIMSGGERQMHGLTGKALV